MEEENTDLLTRGGNVIMYTGCTPTPAPHLLLIPPQSNNFPWYREYATYEMD